MADALGVFAKAVVDVVVHNPAGVDMLALKPHILKFVRRAGPELIEPAAGMIAEKCSSVCHPKSLLFLLYVVHECYCAIVERKLNSMQSLKEKWRTCLFTVARRAFDHADENSLGKIEQVVAKWKRFFFCGLEGLLNDEQSTNVTSTYAPSNSAGTMGVSSSSASTTLADLARTENVPRAAQPQDTQNIHASKTSILRGFKRGIDIVPGSSSATDTSVHAAANPAKRLKPHTHAEVSVPTLQRLDARLETHSFISSAESHSSGIDDSFDPFLPFNKTTGASRRVSMTTYVDGQTISAQRCRNYSFAPPQETPCLREFMGCGLIFKLCKDNQVVPRSTMHWVINMYHRSIYWKTSSPIPVFEYPILALACVMCSKKVVHEERVDAKWWLDYYKRYKQDMPNQEALPSLDMKRLMKLDRRIHLLALFVDQQPLDALKKECDSDLCELLCHELPLAHTLSEQLNQLQADSSIREMCKKIVKCDSFLLCPEMSIVDPRLVGATVILFAVQFLQCPIATDWPTILQVKESDVKAMVGLLQRWGMGSADGGYERELWRQWEELYFRCDTSRHSSDSNASVTTEHTSTEYASADTSSSGESQLLSLPETEDLDVKQRTRKNLPESSRLTCQLAMQLPIT